MRADVFFAAAAPNGCVVAVVRGRAVSAYSPSIDPTDTGYANYTLDLSHTATAGMDALALADRMGGDRLTHLHLADGGGVRHSTSI